MALFWGYLRVGVEGDRRRKVRLQVLRVYFVMIERGDDDVTHAGIASEAKVSVHAVGRVLRWAERRGLAVSSDPRHRLSGPDQREQARENLRMLDDAGSAGGCDGGPTATDG